MTYYSISFGLNLNIVGGYHNSGNEKPNIVLMTLHSSPLYTI